MRMPALVRATVALGALLLVSAFGQAQEAPPTAPPAAPAPTRVAIVDWTKLSSDWTLEVAESEAFQTWFSRQNDVYKQIMLFAYLFDDEMKDVLRIARADAAPSDQDQARLRELEKLSKDRETEFQALKPKDADGTITPQEKERLSALRDCSSRRQEQFAQLKQEMEQEARTKLTELGTRLRDTKLQVIQTVAQAGGVSVVLSSDAVVWSGPDVADITAQVIEALNRDHPAPPAPAAGGGGH